MAGRKLSSVLASGAATVGVAWVKGCRRGAAVAVALLVTLILTEPTPAIAVPPPPESTPLQTGLMDVQTGRCLDSNAAGNVYTNPCQMPGNAYQDWVETSWGAPSVSFQDVATGRCLDSNAAGNLYTLPCQAPGNPYQDWDSSGTRFLDHATQRCLDSNYAGNAYTLPCNGGGFQNWEPVGGPPPAPQPPPSPSGSDPAPATGGQGTEPVPSSPVNKRAAAAWALANVNTAPYLFRADDCTNFVSEALAYGGGDPQTVGQSSVNDWFFFMWRFGTRYSLSWTVAHDLAVHQEVIHSYWIRYWREASPGDLIFADWSGSSFAGISHVGVITGMRNGQPLITQHSPSQRNVLLNYWLTQGGPDVHVWIAVPNAG
jgi:hypothetical protein